MFITVFTTGRHMSLLSDRSIQPKPSHYPISLISIPPPPTKKHKLFTTIDVFLTKAHGVLCEVRTESLHIMTVEQLASGSAPRPPSFSRPCHPACPLDYGPMLALSRHALPESHPCLWQWCRRSSQNLLTNTTTGSTDHQT
jgi:hypothetical protein